ncbi:LamG-like jellyroll fold domain-containing protein [Paraliomyxa miuraensis]|uniref:LamG-like jellyroll fold domain-containing protein n=1 Tax=Paraliomyxa miuraensis TaxID=376150 RepID=UPI00224F651A|nr:LamG-like jellyroll fold domain-containing protein [Paraliomyxa miuraensis]MCX4245193.1 hypothetical protein [Paraliomyxa miuraensis]
MNWTLGTLVGTLSWVGALLLVPSVAQAETLSCAGACDGSVSNDTETCYCDELCTGYGDCCTDYPTTCGSSCDGLCGQQAGTCYCDELCTGYGDCCEDFEPLCAVGLDDPYEIQATSLGEAEEIGLAVTRYGTRTLSIDSASPSWSATDLRNHEVQGGRTVIYTSAVRWHRDATLTNLQERAAEGEDVQDQLDLLSPNFEWLRVTGPLGEELHVYYDVADTRWKLGRHFATASSANMDPPTQDEWHTLALALDLTPQGAFRQTLYIDGEEVLSSAPGIHFEDMVLQEQLSIGRDASGLRSALETGPLYVVETESSGVEPLAALAQTTALVPEPGLLGSWPLLDCFYGNFGEVPVSTSVDTTAFTSCSIEAGIDGWCPNDGTDVPLDENGFPQECLLWSGEWQRNEREFGPGMGLMAMGDHGLEPEEAITFGGRVHRQWSTPTDGPEWIVANRSLDGGYELYLHETSATAVVTIAGHGALTATADLAGIGDHHYARTLSASYDAESGQLRLMVDGKVRARSQGPAGGLMQGSSMPMGIGHNPQLAEAGHLQATLADVRIYDHVISTQSLARWSYRWHGDLESGRRTWPRHTEVDEGAWIVDYDPVSDVMTWTGAALNLYTNDNHWRVQRGVNMLAPPRFELDPAFPFPSPTEISVGFRMGYDAGIDGSLGLIYGYQDDDNYYRLRFGSQGVDLTVFTGGVPYKLIEEPDLWWLHMPPNAPWGTLEVKHVDDGGMRRHTISINGYELVHDEPWPEHDGGRVGLFAEALETVHFRNLSVTGGAAPLPYDGLTAYARAGEPWPDAEDPAWPAWSKLTTPTPTPTGTFLDNEDPPYLLMDAVCKSDPKNAIACMGGGLFGLVPKLGGDAVMAFYVVAAIIPWSLYNPPAAGDAYFYYYDGTRAGHPVWCAEWAINSNVQIHTWCWEDKEAWWLDGGPAWEPYGGI